MAKDRKQSINTELAITEVAIKDRGLSPASSGTPMPTVKPAAQSSGGGAQSSGSSSTKSEK